MITHHTSALMFPDLGTIAALAASIDASPSVQIRCSLRENCMTFRWLVGSLSGFRLWTRLDYKPIADGTFSMAAVHAIFVVGIGPDHMAMATLPVGRAFRHD
jgi:hypothetical protein